MSGLHRYVAALQLLALFSPGYGSPLSSHDFSLRGLNSTFNNSTTLASRSSTFSIGGTGTQLAPTQSSIGTAIALSSSLGLGNPATTGRSSNTSHLTMVSSTQGLSSTAVTLNSTKTSGEPTITSGRTSSSIFADTSHPVPGSADGQDDAKTPSGATVIGTTLSDGQTVNQTFIPTTYSSLPSLSRPTTITTVEENSSVRVVVGTGGLGWIVPSQSSGMPSIPPPTIAPTLSLSIPSEAPTTSVTVSTFTSGGITLPVITVPSSKVSTESTNTIAGITGNTIITTTDKHGHRGPAIALFPCLFFCGGGHGVNLLWGIGPAPGIYMLPGLPRLTIGPDNVPTPEKSNDQPTSTEASKSTSSSTSSGCTTKTASACSTSCAAGGDCSTTCSATATGCSVSGSNTATTVTVTPAPWKSGSPAGDETWIGASQFSTDVAASVASGVEAMLSSWGMYDPVTTDNSTSTAATSSAQSKSSARSTASSSAPTSSMNITTSRSSSASTQKTPNSSLSSTNPTKTTNSISSTRSSSSARPFWSSSTTSVPPATNTCVGNQVEGSCVQGSLPSTEPNHGPHDPVCNKFGTDANALLRRIDSTKAQQAAADYCHSLAVSRVVLTKNSSGPKPHIVSGAAENGGDLALVVSYNVDYCPADGSMTTVDFTTLSVDECQQNFNEIVQFCAQDPTWGDYNADYTMEGGVLGNDCAIWGMTGQPS